MAVKVGVALPVLEGLRLLACHVFALKFVLVDDIATGHRGAGGFLFNAVGNFWHRSLFLPAFHVGRCSRGLRLKLWLERFRLLPLCAAIGFVGLPSAAGRRIV